MAYTGTALQTQHSGRAHVLTGAAGIQKVTRREALMRAIAYHVGIEAPILNTSMREYMRSPLYSWIMGHISFDRTTIPADVEGKQHTALGSQAGAGRVRGWNGIHIHSKDVVVSDIQRNTDEVSVPDEYQHQVWEAMAALMVEYENIVIWSPYVAGAPGDLAGSGTAPQTHGLAPWAIWTGGGAATVTVTAQQVPAEFKSTYYAGTGVDMTRTQLNEQLLQPYWEKGGELDRTLVFVGTKVKNVISNYAMIYNGSGATLSSTPLNERSIPAGAMALIDKIDIYEGDWGRMFVIKNRNMSNATIPAYTSGDHGLPAPLISPLVIDPRKALLGYQPRYVALNIFEAPNHVPLAKQGSFSAGYCEAVIGTIVRNPRALMFGHNLAG